MPVSKTPGPKPTYLVVEENLHYQSKAQGEIVLNLDFPFQIMIDASDGSQNETAIFGSILTAIGDESTLKKIGAMGSLEAMRLVNRFFAEFQKLVGAPVGESEGSSS